MDAYDLLLQSYASANDANLRMLDGVLEVLDDARRGSRSDARVEASKNEMVEAMGRLEALGGDLDSFVAAFSECQRDIAADVESAGAQKCRAFRVEYLEFLSDQKLAGQEFAGVLRVMGTGLDQAATSGTVSSETIDEFGSRIERYALQIDRISYEDATAAANICRQAAQ